MKISKARLIEIIKEELSAVHEGHDYEGEEDDEFIHRSQEGQPTRWEKAKQAGEADGEAGRPARDDFHGLESEHYMAAYRDAFNRTAPARAQKARQRLKLRASDLERQQKLRFKNP